MDPFDDLILNSILQTNDSDIVLKTEDERVEYKGIYDNADASAKSKYVKELAAMYNSKGGYLFFGVEKGTNKLKGLENFDEPDSAHIADDINKYFKPAFSFRQKKISVKGKILFVLYVDQRQDIPTVCIKTYPEIVKSGVIYVKYSSQASPIEAEDLIHLLSSLKSQDTNRLVDFHEKNLSREYKPKFGGRTSGFDTNSNSFKIILTNANKRLLVKSITSNTEGVFAHSYMSIPSYIEQDQKFGFQVTCQNPLEIMNKDYVVHLLVQNEIEEDYVFEIRGQKNSNIKIADPIKK